MVLVECLVLWSGHLAGRLRNAAPPSGSGAFGKLAVLKSHNSGAFVAKAEKPMAKSEAYLRPIVVFLPGSSFDYKPSVAEGFWRRRLVVGRLSTTSLPTKFVG